MKLPRSLRTGFLVDDDTEITLVKRAASVALLALLTLFVSMSVAVAQDSPGSDLGRACPGAAAWNAAHADQLPEAMKARDAARALGNPGLRHELEERVTVDQAAREALLTGRGRSGEVGRIDADNDEWLVGILKKDGFPKADQVGEYGLHLMWLLVQHADTMPKLQSLALGEFLKRFNDGEFSGDDLARLSDRVLLHQGKPQRFGTQFDWTADKFHPKPMEEPDEVAAHRRQIGLMPLDDYACMKTEELKLLRR